MVANTKFLVVTLAALAGAGALCPLCEAGTAAERNVPAMQPASDTATVKLHISGMTCGSCPATARLALKKLTGVYSAQVRLEDSLGVVRYDPKQVTPAQIGAYLTQKTGFGARIVSESPKKAVGRAG